PSADVELQEAALDAHGHVARLGDDARRLASPLERRGIDGHHLLELGDAGGGGLSLLAALLGEVETAGAAGQFHAGGGGEAGAHEEDDGRGRGLLVFHRAVRNAASSSQPTPPRALRAAQLEMRPSPPTGARESNAGTPPHPALSPSGGRGNRVPGEPPHAVLSPSRGEGVECPASPLTRPSPPPGGEGSRRSLSLPGGEGRVRVIQWPPTLPTAPRVLH